MRARECLLGMLAMAALAACSNDSFKGSAASSGTSGSSGSSGATTADDAGGPATSAAEDGGSPQAADDGSSMLTTSDAALDKAIETAPDPSTNPAFMDGGTSIVPKCPIPKRAEWPFTRGGADGSYNYRETTVAVADIDRKYPHWFQIEIGADGSDGYPSRVSLGSLTFSNAANPLLKMLKRQAVGDDSYLALGRDGLWVKKVGYPSEPVGVDDGKIDAPKGTIYVKAEVPVSIGPAPTSFTVFYCD